MQKVVALSTREAKYMVVVEARMGIFWMKDFIGELGIRKRIFHWHRLMVVD